MISAQEEAFKNFKHGMPASQLDYYVRKYVEERGYGKLYPHRLGHGIGVRLHEPPALHPASTEKLYEKSTFTVEPGLYGKDFGIRVEDVVAGLKKGVEKLTLFENSL